MAEADPVAHSYDRAGEDAAEREERERRGSGRRGEVDGEAAQIRGRRRGSGGGDVKSTRRRRGFGAETASGRGGGCGGGGARGFRAGNRL